MPDKVELWPRSAALTFLARWSGGLDTGMLSIMLVSERVSGQTPQLRSSSRRS